MTDRPGQPREPLPTSVELLPELPAQYDRALEAGLAALRLDLPSVARSAIDTHVRLLLAWTPFINLTSLRDPAEIATRHVIDSLSALQLISGAEGRLLDLGSGGGFPGLPLAAARPDLDTALVESVGKKTRFLSTVVAATGLADHVRVEAERVEGSGQRPSDRATFAIVTARAVGDLVELVELAFPLLRIGGRLIAWKRTDVGAEVVAARRALAAFGGGSIDVVPVGVAALPGHVHVVVTKRGWTPEGYPRDPGLRKRRAP